MKRAFLTVLALLAGVAASIAAPGAPTYQLWSPVARAALSVTSASANVQLVGGLAAWICNTGANDAFLKFGTANTVVAVAATDFKLQAGACQSYDLQPTSGTKYTWVAAITASSTAALYIETGLGSLRNQSPTSVASITGALPAGEAHVGETGSNKTTVAVAQTVTAASAYTTGNSVGGLMTLAGATRVSGSVGAAGTSGALQSVLANLKSAQTTQIDIFLFRANPTGSTCTDKTAFVLATADFDKVFGVAHITDWTAGNVASLGQIQNLAMPYTIASGTTLWACAVTRGTPTYTATTDVTFAFNFLRD